MTDIKRRMIPEMSRMHYVANLFGIQFPLKLEPTIYMLTDLISPDYEGGFWHFYELSNGGFYMAPAAEHEFAVVCDNGYAGYLSADALGITACLYTYSQLSFGSQSCFATRCAEHYHSLRDYMLTTHAEVGEILRAID